MSSDQRKSSTNGVRINSTELQSNMNNNNKPKTSIQLDEYPSIACIHLSDNNDLITVIDDEYKNKINLIFIRISFQMLSILMLAVVIIQQVYQHYENMKILC